jgi:hypothetical protein
MKVRCIKNEGNDLRSYEYEPIFGKEVFGRFGASGFTQYEIEIGKEYIVMGIIIFQTYQAYLIDDSGFISTCPCQLFEILDDKIDTNWHFRLIDKDEDIYPFIQAIFGYTELCSDKKAYESLIVEKEEYAEQVYFKQKIGLEEILKLRSLQ